VLDLVSSVPTGTVDLVTTIVNRIARLRFS
jgi:hypothetical protein